MASPPAAPVLLLTGARGIIGRHAVALLADQGYRVHALGRTPGQDARITWHAADLLDTAATARAVAAIRPSHLLHLAWTTEHGRFWSDPANLDWVGASLSLLRAFAAAGGRRAVLVGSCAEYDFSAPGPWAEDAPLVPHTLYGAAKDGLRRIAEPFCRGAGIDLAWARLFLLCGEGEAPARLVPSLVRAFAAGQPARTGPGERQVDLIDTRDAGRALADLLLSDVQGPVNVARGVPASISEIAGTLAALAGRPDLLAVGALPARAGDPPSLLADTTRLQDTLGFLPRFDLQAMLADALART